MDQDRFDDLARTLASTTSRRTVLKSLAGGAAGGLLALLGVGEAAADPAGCKRNGQKWKEPSQCCSGTCANGTCVVATPNSWSCFCTDEQIIFCSSEPCRSENILAFCALQCADHGGGGGGGCTGNSPRCT